MSAARSSTRWPRLAALASLSIGLLGCPSPDPQGKFDGYIEETKEEREEFANMKMDMGSQLADVTGEFLFAIEPAFNPDLYLQFIATTTLTPDDATGGATMSITFQPLSLMPTQQNLVPREPVGEPIVVEGIEVSPTGAFRIDSLGGEVMVTGEANPITGSDIVADLGIEGFIQDETLYCGTVFGMVIAPLMLDLAGSTFGAERLEATDPASLPTDIVFRCPEDGMMGGGGESGDGGSGSGSGG